MTVTVLIVGLVVEDGEAVGLGRIVTVDVKTFLVLLEEGVIVTVLNVDEVVVEVIDCVVLETIDVLIVELVTILDTVELVESVVAEIVELDRIELVLVVVSELVLEILVVAAVGDIVLD